MSKQTYRFMHWGVLIRAGIAYWNENISRCASSLTISTLLAMVPLMAIALALIQILPMFSGIVEQLQDFIFTNFVPDTSKTIEKQLDYFAKQANALTKFGLIFLFITVVFLIVNLEISINYIWHYGVDKHPLWKRLVKHLTIILLFPLLIGISFMFSSFLLHGLGQFKQTIMPTFATYCGFLLLYKVVPNGHVPLVPALWGALVGAALFEVMKQLFAVYLAYFHAYEIIYGALSVLPILIVWLYLIWTIVLYCCTITREMSVRASIKDE